MRVCMAVVVDEGEVARHRGRGVRVMSVRSRERRAQNDGDARTTFKYAPQMFSVYMSPPM